MGFILSFLLQTNLFGQGEESECPQSFCVNYEDWAIEVGGNYTHLKLDPSELSSFSGNLGGVQFSLEYRPVDSVYEAVTFLWREGNVDGSSLERSIFDVDAQARLGMTKKICEESLATLFTGFGWRYLGHELTGLVPLDLNYNEVYIPVGLLLQYRPMNSFSIGLNGIWKPQIFATVNFVPLDNIRWVTDCMLANFLIELPLIYRFTTWCNDAVVELRPFFEFWQDGATIAATSEGIALGLLKNTYYFVGVQLNLGVTY